MPGLDTALTPLRFLERAAQVHPTVIDGGRRLAYREFAAAVTRTAHALRVSGLAAGDRAACLGTNSAEPSPPESADGVGRRRHGDG